MISSIKFIVTTAFLLTVTVFSFAQRGGDKDHDPAKKAEKQTARMVENLSLNDKQAIDVKAINLVYANKMKDAHVANKGKDREAMKTVRADLEKGRSVELAKVLTASQFETYEAKKADITGKRKKGKNVTAEERAEKSTVRMVENLSLDEAQTAKVRAINLAHAQNTKKAHEANKGKDKSAMKLVRADLDKNKTAALTKVLNTDQLKKYQEMKAKKMTRKKGEKKKARS